jgi:hypothetical protein
MELNTINLHALHNEEHFELQKEFKQLVELKGAKTLNIETVFNAYLPFYAKEEEALNLIRKSATTGQIELADNDRDTLISGLKEAVRSQLKHFDAEKRAAAARFKIILDQYGDIAHKPYDDETAAIHKLVQESKETYANEVSILALTDWINAIDKKNLEFQSLKKDRHSEDAQKTLMRMKTVRVDIDAAYKEVVKRINALIVVNGPAGHEVFVREFNSRIDKINNTIAQRKGRANKTGEKDNPDK